MLVLQAKYKWDARGSGPEHGTRVEVVEQVSLLARPCQRWRSLCAPAQEP